MKTKSIAIVTALVTILGAACGANRCQKGSVARSQGGGADGAGCTKDIVAGEHATCALQPEGWYCWGSNNYDVLGDPNFDRPNATDFYAGPLRPSWDHHKWDALSLGGRLGCGLERGYVYCWGENLEFLYNHGDTQDPNNLRRRRPHQVLDFGNDVVRLAATSGLVCVQKADNRIVCKYARTLPGKHTFQFNFGGRLNELKVGASACGISKGLLHCWGPAEWAGGVTRTETDEYVMKPVTFPEFRDDILEFSVGSHLCVVRKDHSLWCWGAAMRGDGTVQRRRDKEDQTHPPSSNPHRVTALGNQVAHVVAGWGVTCATKLDGSIWCWGINPQGQAGPSSIDLDPHPDRRDFVQPTPTELLALGKDNGRLFAEQEQVCTIKRDGRVFCWGRAGARGEKGLQYRRSYPLPSNSFHTHWHVWGPLPLPCSGKSAR